MLFQFTNTVDKKHVHIVCRAKNYVPLQLMVNISVANLWWDRHFADWIFTPRSILQLATACRNYDEAILYWHPLYFWHLPCGKAALLPCSIVWMHLYIGNSVETLVFASLKPRSHFRNRSLISWPKFDRNLPEQAHAASFDFGPESWICSTRISVAFRSPFRLTESTVGGVLGISGLHSG